MIELMITVAIVGILAGIALPSYRSYILKIRRAEAMSELTKAQTVIERCYGANFTYVGTCKPSDVNNHAERLLHHHRRLRSHNLYLHGNCFWPAGQRYNLRHHDD
jgi:type IV pilus assembly protein PilE